MEKTSKQKSFKEKRRRNIYNFLLSYDLTWVSFH